MVIASDIKFYKSNNNGLGGGIDTTQLINSTSINNLFPIVGPTEAAAGSTRYLLMYIKNTHSTDTAKSFSFWKEAGSKSDKTTMYWGKGPTGEDGTEPTIANINTEPTGDIVWKSTNEIVKLVDNLEAGHRFPIWFKSVIDPGTGQIKGNKDVFKFKFTNPSGSAGEPPDPSGGGGGNTGGNTDTTINWSIAVVGDMDGTSSRTDTVMNMFSSYNKVILVGDYAYGDPSDWINKAENHNIKSKIVGMAFGNHEYDDGVSDYKNWFGVSKTYFMKKFQNVAVITVDSEIDLDTGSTQNDQIRTFLNDASADPAIDWIFVTMHRPWFGSKSDHPNNEFGQVEAFHSLFTGKKVAFVLVGHNHNWQRSAKCKYNSSDPEDPTVTDSTTPYANDSNGLIHVVSGAGGHDSEGNLYSLKTTLGSSGNPNIYQNKSHLGIFSIKASNNGKTLTCEFKDIDGGTHDTFTYTTT